MIVTCIACHALLAVTSTSSLLPRAILQFVQRGGKLYCPCRQNTCFYYVRCCVFLPHITSAHCLLSSCRLERCPGWPGTQIVNSRVSYEEAMTRWRKNHDSYCLKSVYFEAEYSLFNKLVQKLRKGKLSVWVSWRLILDITEGANWSFNGSFLARDCTDGSFSSPLSFSF